MSKKAKVEITVEENDLTKGLKKSKSWYSLEGVIALLFLGFVDCAGFVQGALQYIQDNIDTEKVAFSISTYGVHIIMVLGFIVAFEGATIYMAYAFSLHLYHYDKQAIKRINPATKSVSFSKFVSTSTLGWISFGAFLLGFVLNIIFRIGILEDAIINIGREKAIAITVVMIFLPVITSILNFVIGCFTFDPLLFEMNYYSKQMAKLKSDINELDEQEKVIDEELNWIETLKEENKNSLMEFTQYSINMEYPLKTKFYKYEVG